MIVRQETPTVNTKTPDEQHGEKGNLPMLTYFLYIKGGENIICLLIYVSPENINCCHFFIYFFLFMVYDVQHYWVLRHPVMSECEHYLLSQY